MAEALKSDTQAAITLAELQASEAYLACTTKMRLWLTTLIESGWDHTLATSVAFDCKDVREAQIFSYAIRNWARIRACLNFYLGRSEHEVELQQERNERAKLLRKVRRNLRHAEPGSIAAQRLLIQEERLALGGKVAAATDHDVESVESQSEIARFKVGDICVQSGQKYRVTSVDANGKPLTADEIE